MANKNSSLPDYQREFSARSVKNYIAGILGNAATSGFSAMLFSSWLTFVFTEYLGVGAAAIAAVVSVGVIVDGVSDFLMGIVLDRVISRWGKARHWFFISALPVGLTIALMWMVPVSTSSAFKLVWAFLMYNIFCTFLTTVRMSVQAMPALVSDSTKVRSNMAYTINIVSSFSSAALGWVITPVTAHFGNTLTAYRVVALICAIITLVFTFVSGVLLTEQRSGEEWKQIKAEYRTRTKQAKDETVFQQIKNLLKNKYWLFYLFINIASGCGVFFPFGVMAHWINYVLCDPTKTGIMMTVMNIPCLIGTFLYMPISRKLDVRTIAIGAALGQAIFGLVAWIAGAQHFTVFIVASVIKTFIGGVQAPVSMVIIPRIVDYGEWKTGSRQEGLCNSGIGIISKVMSALATALVGIILGLAGYTSGATLPGSALSAINFMYLGLPTISLVVCGVLWFFFDLSEKKADEYRAEVKEREAAAKQDN
jgi:glycoside/pentoside/hexuronide:cation symporter, GPH family